jgi:hypothetical protein
VRVRPRLWPLAVAALALAGLLVRVWVLRGRWGVVDSDEAVVGLMARAFLDGEWRAFYWGQHYAGSLEPALVALFGASGAALKLVPVALSAVSSVLVWRIGRRLFDERLAQGAGLLFWVAPGAYVWWSTKERGFYWTSMALGLVLLLAAVRLVQESHWRRDGAVFGLAAGLGFWVSPTVLYFAVPAVVWLLARRSRPLRWLTVAVPAALLGALPWLWHNLFDEFPSLERPPQPETVSYLGGIGRLLRETMPITVNLRYPIGLDWLGGPIGKVLYVALGLALVVAFVVRRDRPLLVFGGLALFPFVYAWFPGAWFVGEGRYALFVAPFLALAIAWLVRREHLAIALCAVTAFVSIGMIGAMGSEQPQSIGGDLRALKRAGVTHLWGDYWYSYRLGFVSGGWLTASPFASSRDDELYVSVLRSRRPAFLYPKGDGRVAALQAAVDHDTELLHTPHFDVVLVEGRVDPAALPPGTAP